MASSRDLARPATPLNADTLQVAEKLIDMGFDQSVALAAATSGVSARDGATGRSYDVDASVSLLVSAHEPAPPSSLWRSTLAWVRYMPQRVLDGLTPSDATRSVASLLADTYAELGAWSVGELLLGLSYLKAHKMATPGADQLPAAAGAFAGGDRALVLAGLRYLRVALASYLDSAGAVAASLGLRTSSDVVVFERSATMLRPAYAIAVDHGAREVLLSLRGTDTLSDVLTDCCAVAAALDGRPGGLAHAGMQRAADWFVTNEAQRLRALLVANPGYELRLCGHSLGGGSAALLALRLADAVPGVRAFAYGPPPCCDSDTAAALADRVVCFILHFDLVSRASLASVEALRLELQAFPWWQRARDDLAAKPLLATSQRALAAITESSTVQAAKDSVPVVSVASAVSACSTALAGAALWTWQRASSLVGAQPPNDPFAPAAPLPLLPADASPSLLASQRLVLPGTLYDVFRAPGQAGDLVDGSEHERWMMAQVPSDAFASVLLHDDMISWHRGATYLRALQTLADESDVV